MEPEYLVFGTIFCCIAVGLIVLVSRLIKAYSVSDAEN